MARADDLRSFIEGVLATQGVRHARVALRLCQVPRAANVEYSDATLDGTPAEIATQLAGVKDDNALDVLGMEAVVYLEAGEATSDEARATVNRVRAAQGFPELPDTEWDVRVLRLTDALTECTISWKRRTPGLGGREDFPRTK